MCLGHPRVKNVCEFDLISIAVNTQHVRYLQNYIQQDGKNMTVERLNLQVERFYKITTYCYILKLTPSDEVISLKASVTWSAVAPPPTSRKFAGSPPCSFMISIVDMAKPAPFTAKE